MLFRVVPETQLTVTANLPLVPGSSSGRTGLERRRLTGSILYRTDHSSYERLATLGRQRGVTLAGFLRRICGLVLLEAILGVATGLFGFWTTVAAATVGIGFVVVNYVLEANQFRAKFNQEVRIHEADHSGSCSLQTKIDQISVFYRITMRTIQYFIHTALS